MRLLSFLLLSTCWCARYNTVHGQAFYSTSDIGAPNLAAAVGNPLKGLMGGARWKNPSEWPTQPVTSLEWYNFAFDEVLMDENTTDWSLFENHLVECASRNRHAVVSVRTKYGVQIYVCICVSLTILFHSSFTCIGRDNHSGCPISS